jgi:hypothetical protein
MNATETAPAPVTPTDAPTPAAPRKRASPRRFKLFDDGGGDFRVYEVIGAGHKTLPQGSIVPIPEFGGYNSAIDAKKALKAGGDKLQGKTIMIWRGVEMIRIVLETKPRVMFESKPRKQVSGPPEVAAPATAGTAAPSTN